MIRHNDRFHHPMMCLWLTMMNVVVIDADDATMSDADVDVDDGAAAAAVGGHGNAGWMDYYWTLSVMVAAVVAVATSPSPICQSNQLIYMIHPNVVNLDDDDDDADADADDV